MKRGGLTARGKGYDAKGFVGERTKTSPNATSKLSTLETMSVFATRNEH